MEASELKTDPVVIEWLKLLTQDRTLKRSLRVSQNLADYMEKTPKQLFIEAED
jgi:hypothetical protein